jgi:hypothetical protein
MVVQEHCSRALETMVVLVEPTVVPIYLLSSAIDVYQFSKFLSSYCNSYLILTGLAVVAVAVAVAVIGCHTAFLCSQFVDVVVVGGGCQQAKDLLHIEHVRILLFCWVRGLSNRHLALDWLWAEFLSRLPQCIQCIRANNIKHKSEVTKLNGPNRSSRKHISVENT